MAKENTASSSVRQVLKGFRDFLPAEMRVRNRVCETFIKIFEKYGFEPLETPALEYAETLLGKYGEEADKLVYTFRDRGDRKVGLRYDLTVPVSRVLATYRDEIPLPFKRYQIQRVWRADKPQKGRYREFVQCDIDTFGTASPLADAEIIAVIYECLKALNFEKFIIKINSRQVLLKILEEAKVPKEKQFPTLQSLDKLEKDGKETVEKELLRKGLNKENTKKLFEAVAKAEPDENLKMVLDYLRDLEIPEEFYKYDPTMIRGLDYYTGPIFETYVEEPSASRRIGSVTGGGRYDNLVKQLGGPDIPATGTTIGLDRICDVVTELQLLKDQPASSTKVLVTVFSPEFKDRSLKALNYLRENDVNSEIYLEEDAKLDKQLKYANRKGIPFVLIIGPEEATKDVVTLKEMASGDQKTLKLSETIKQLLP